MECNICYINKKLIKCEKCSFACCMNCISKLNNLELWYDKVWYDCCVCKDKNNIYIKDIKDISVMRSLYKKQTINLLEIQNDPVILSSLILIYNVPVISNNKVNYYKNCIIALKTQQDNNTVSLELYDRFAEFDLNYKIRKFNENNISVKDHFIYSTDDFDYTLLKNADFYELCSNGVIDYV
jgi:hypothetical protein